MEDVARPVSRSIFETLLAMQREGEALEALASLASRASRVCYDAMQRADAEAEAARIMSRQLHDLYFKRFFMYDKASRTQLASLGLLRMPLSQAADR